RHYLDFPTRQANGIRLLPFRPDRVIHPIAMPFAVDVHDIEVMPGRVVGEPGYHFSCLVGIGCIVEITEDVFKLVGAKHPGMTGILPAGVFARVATLAGLGAGISRCWAACML